MRGLGARGLLVVAACAGWGTTMVARPAAAQTAEQKGSARSMAEQGKVAFEEQRYADAADLFQRAEKLYHAPPHLLYLAKAQLQLGQLVEARENLRTLEREPLTEASPPVFLAARDEATPLLESLEPRIPYLTLRVKGADTKELAVTVNDQPYDSLFVGAARPINPGHYRVQAKSATLESRVVEFDVAEGEKPNVEVTLDVPRPVAEQPKEAGPEGGGSSKVPAYVALGVGAVGVGVGAAFSILHLTKSSDAQSAYDTCVTNGNCGPNDRTSIEAMDADAATFGTVALIGFGVGAVGLGTGLVLLFTGNDSAPPPSTGGVTVRPVLGFNRVGLTGTF
ncbi:MAG TPA: hypothetical protein VLC09_07985 [Polyangiaceae bacterium]|nr:hypothetical protein [Polyangiaceae bacterium]